MTLKDFSSKSILRSITNIQRRFAHLQNSVLYDRTIVDMPKPKFSLNHSSRVMFVGSCFSEVINKEMLRRKFPYILSNPQGIVFNPSSICQIIHNCRLNRIYTVDDLFIDNNDDVYHSWSHHSSFSHKDPAVMLTNINKRLSEAHEFLKMCDVLVLTLGTAFFHSLRSSDYVVSNCHKQPSALFNKSMLLTSTIVDEMKSMIESLKEFNPKLQILMTVSPVRHSREGLVENQLSKATLLCSVHELIKTFPNQVSYFPSYEILMDELRDYRWYADDMIHPSSMSETIIFERFSDSYLDVETKKICNEVIKALKRVDHRPIVQDSISYIKHVNDTLQLLKSMETVHPSISFEEERKLLQRYLTGLVAPNA